MIHGGIPIMLNHNEFKLIVESSPNMNWRAGTVIAKNLVEKDLNEFLIWHKENIENQCYIEFLER